MNEEIRAADARGSAPERGAHLDFLLRVGPKGEEGRSAGARDRTQLFERRPVPAGREHARSFPGQGERHGAPQAA